MAAKIHTIALDESMAAALKERADERGISVPDLLAEYLDEDHRAVGADAEQTAELDRRWAAIEGGQATVKHDKVVGWLETWGTPGFAPWRNR
jgi:predicted transcriptional regulator